MTRWVYPQGEFTTSSLRKHGCGPASMVAALVRASDGTWAPKGKGGTTSARVRLERSGASATEFNARGLTPSQVFRSMQGVRASDERMDLPVQWRHGVDVTGQLLPQLRRIGGGAIVAVDYSRIQRAGCGQGSYQGDHWVFVDDPDAGTVRVADPIRDRLVRWPIDVLVDGMERFGTRPWLHGRGEAIVVWPWLTWRQGHSAQSAALKASQNEAKALRAALEACEARA